MKSFAVGVLLPAILSAIFISTSCKERSEAEASPDRLDQQEASHISLGPYEGRLALSSGWTQNNPATNHRIAEFELPSPDIDRVSKGQAAVYVLSNADAEALIMTWIYQIEQSENELFASADACGALLSAQDPHGWLRISGEPSFVDSDDQWGVLKEKESIPSEWRCSIAIKRIENDVLALRLVGPLETVDDAEQVGTELLASISRAQGSSRQ